jgi:ABC-type Fe3+ transport system permease subunit
VWSAASVVFLFCSTAFGVVLVLGGLRYGTVETEIYLLTTTLLDLRGAAVLSVLQFVAVVAMLALTAAIQRRAAPGTRRPGGAAAAAAGDPSREPGPRGDRRRACVGCRAGRLAGASPRCAATGSGPWPTIQPWPG